MGHPPPGASASSAAPRAGAAADVRAIGGQLESGALTADAALDPLARMAHAAPVRAERIEAYRLIGDIAGRAFDASWETAERAAWVLLDNALHVDGVSERCALLVAMGRGFHNVWLMPFVHRRLADESPAIVAAALSAAGGLGLPALEEAVAEFLAADRPRPWRLAAVAALGRMGAVSASDRLVPLLHAEADVAAAALTALTEIRSPAGAATAAPMLERGSERSLMLAAMRYLAELGCVEVLPTLRRLARDEDAELRLAAGLASRAFKAERSQDAGERLLVALAERDRAVRAALARRLRTVPTDRVLAQAALLMGDDPEGVVHILGELRDPDTTRFLLELGADPAQPLPVRSLALSSIEARDASVRVDLARTIASTEPEALRVAAVHALGSFASFEELMRLAGSTPADPAPDLRGAFLWALQLAVRPGTLGVESRTRCEAELRRALRDPVPWVRRRAAYVAGNLGLRSLAQDLVALARGETERVDLRVAAFVGLGELGSPSAFDDIVLLSRREREPGPLAAASRVLQQTAIAHPEKRSGVGELRERTLQQLRSMDPMVREAAVRLTGVSGGAIPAAALVALARYPVPRVRDETLAALGRLGSPEAEAPLLAAFDDPDPSVHERAAEGLLALGQSKAYEAVLGYAMGEGDAEGRARIAARIPVPESDAAALLELLDRGLGRLAGDDPAYEPLLALKVRLLERSRPAPSRATSVEDSILAMFPAYPRIAEDRRSETLARSLRTAEALYGTTIGIRDADLSPAIVLWMKSMEGYVHGWLAGRLETLQRDPRMLFEHVDRLLLDSWPTYQGFVSQRWKDSVDVGQAHVEVPLRSVANALREFQEHRPKRLDSPLSVTEWARLMVFFGVDHPAGVRNLFRFSSRNADQVLRLAHRLHTLAAVRNLVTHRAAAAASTLDAFRKTYYGAFEELTKLR